MIIDMHGHLGDILYPNGQELIYRTGVVMQKGWDPQATNEAQLNRGFGIGKLAYEVTKYWATKGQRARNFTATLENLRTSLDESNINYAVCLPIAPYITFDDLAEAKEQEDRILPFTSIDFSSSHDVEAKLSEDVAKGALGLKLHPIIQNTSLDDERTLRGLQSFGMHKKPVLIHVGPSTYYLGSEKKNNTPEFGQVHYVEDIIRTFPDIKFMVGHAGLFWINEVCQRLGKFTNVWVDTSFQSPEGVRHLVKVFGAEKVLYASDWPFGSRAPHIKIIKLACRGDSRLEEMLLYQNAQALLGIHI
jgi:predicted TIM-barrel fold metal-dependent hydrolase